VLSKAFGWLVSYVLPLLLAVAAVVAATGAWFYYQDNARIEGDRLQTIERFIEQERELLERRQVLEERLSEVRRELTDAQMRLNEAQRLAHRLRNAIGFWDRLFASREEREARERELARAEREEREANEALRVREERRAMLVEEVETAQAEIESVRAERSELDYDDPDLIHYATRAWESARVPVLVGVGMLVAGPWIFKSFLFFLWAPLVRFAPPLVIRKGEAPPIEASPSKVSLQVDLRPGETLLVKEKFLQASDEGVRRRTKFVFNWKVPFSCLVCGLVELIRMHNASREETYRVTLSTQEEPMTEIAVVEIPVEGSLVLRPRFLAGVILPQEANGKPVRIHRHWRLFSLNAWLTLRFRHFEFRGPCRLIIAGKRGVRLERLENVTREQKRARRTNQTATIGFTPELNHHCIRAETFWSFFRGRNPLFDDLFSGSGSFICQEIAERRREIGVRRLWSGFWNSLLKIFGL
jgi:uncharacterized protein YlxW (UPF0749 family)